ncbi:hypothetical protein Hanom_Chr09g00791891 [Helianthus anomalus]
MHYCVDSEGVPKLPVGSYADQQWYKTLTRNPTTMLQLDEKALVAVGTSLLWLPKNPRAAPIYAYNVTPLSKAEARGVILKGSHCINGKHTT